jgi:hypothetical protein
MKQEMFEEILESLQEKLKTTQESLSECIAKKKELESKLSETNTEVYKLTLLEGHLYKMIEIIKEK